MDQEAREAVQGASRSEVPAEVEEEAAVTTIITRNNTKFIAVPIVRPIRTLQSGDIPKDHAAALILRRIPHTEYDRVLNLQCAKRRHERSASSYSNSSSSYSSSSSRSDVSSTGSTQGKEPGHFKYQLGESIRDYEVA